MIKRGKDSRCLLMLFWLSYDVGNFNGSEKLVLNVKLFYIAKVSQFYISPLTLLLLHVGKRLKEPIKCIYSCATRCKWGQSGPSLLPLAHVTARNYYFAFTTVLVVTISLLWRMFIYLFPKRKKPCECNNVLCKEQRAEKPRNGGNVVGVKRGQLLVRCKLPLSVLKLSAAAGRIYHFPCASELQKLYHRFPRQSLMLARYLPSYLWHWKCENIYINQAFCWPWKKLYRTFLCCGKFNWFSRNGILHSIRSEVAKLHLQIFTLGELFR